MAITTFDQVLASARQLPTRERAQLIARLAEELAVALEAHAPERVPANDAWERLKQLRAEFAQLGPVSPSPAEQLEQDRHERNAMLMGRSEGDVHA